MQGRAEPCAASLAAASHPDFDLWLDELSVLGVTSVTGCSR